MDGPTQYLHFGFILISLDERVKMSQETVELSHPQYMLHFFHRPTHYQAQQQ